ncbi:MAG: DUF4351 domain-containing protein [Candidatus Competibacteraceae bacterium]|nr:MAG: DUF4351 domain-containing protein [Candidatus Competibacteraceae bacterium]
MSETEWAQYRREYLADSDQREAIMGMLSYSRKEGLQQGLQQGESLLLRRLLTRRFGPLPEWAERRLTDAEPAQLERWGERVLEAATLGEGAESAVIRVREAVFGFQRTIGRIQLPSEAENQIHIFQEKKR